MVIRSILLRLSQFLTGTVGLFLLLMAGTFLLQLDFELAWKTAIAWLVAWGLWGLLSFLVHRYDQETIREVALVVYPLGIVLAPSLGIWMGFRLEAMLEDPRYQAWTLIFAGVLLSGVMMVRCLDIRWMRNAQDVRTLESAVHHDD